MDMTDSRLGFPKAQLRRLEKKTRQKIARLLAALRVLWCGLHHGHDDVVRFEPYWLSLRCVSCGRQTKGWKLT